MPTNIGVAKDIFKTIFGLDSETIDKIVRVIQSSGDSTDIQTSNIRSRIGPQALGLIHKGLEAAKMGGDEKKSDKEEKPAPEKKVEKKNDGKKVDVKEGFSLKNYLMSEAVVDTDDPDAAMKVRKRQQMTKNNPDADARLDMNAAREKEKDARSEEDPALKAAKMKEASLEKQLAVARKKVKDLSDKQGQ